MASIAIAPTTGVVTLVPRWAIGGSLAGFHFMAQDLSLGGGANQFYSIKSTAIPAGGDIAAFTRYIAASGAATNHADIGSKLTPNFYSALTSADPDVGYGPVNLYFIHHKSSGDYFTVIVPSSGTASAVTDLKPMSGPGGPATLGTGGYFGLTFAASNLGYGLDFFYYLRTDPATGFTNFGTLDPALLGTSADKFSLGTGGHNALEYTGSDVGFGVNKMYYLRLDPVTSFTILGTLDPGTGQASDIANLGSVYSTLTFVPGDVGFGTSQFYTTGPVNTTWQSVSFAAIANRLLSDGSFTVSPSASSSLPITLTVVSGSTGSATISGPVSGVFTVTPTAGGVITLQASQAGQAAPTAYEFNMLRQSFTVSVTATPTFTPMAGTYTGAQSVSIATATSGASIRYTTDGSTPSETIGTVYVSALTVSATTTLKAIAYKTGLADSTVASAVYIINTVGAVSAPDFSPAGGTFTTAQSVIITSSTSGASIRYTTDGSTPSSTLGTIYFGPVSISATTTFKAIAYKTALTDSAVTSGAFIEVPVAPVNPGVLSDQPVTIGHTATLVASVTGNPPPSIQWQVSTDGGTTWINLSNNSSYSGVTTSTLVITGSAALNGNKYRYVATNGSGSVASNAFTLSVVAAQFPSPTCIVVDSTGNLYVGDSTSNTIQKITTANVVSTFAGSAGLAGSTDATGTSALFRQPGGITIDSAGNLYVADTANFSIRKITPSGVVTTLAGSASNPSYKDGTGTAAWFNTPIGISIDSAGNLYVADSANDVIRKITTPAGVVTTFVGTANATGTIDGTGIVAMFNTPAGVIVDSAGNTYVADTNNDTLRKVTTGGVVGTLAGLAQTTGSSNGFDNSALFNLPTGLAVDTAGNIYMADTANSTIRKITPAGVVSTLAGLAGIAGLQDGTGSGALFNQPKDLTVDSSGNVYVADTGNASIRKITPAGVVTTLVVSVAPGSTTPTAPAPAPASSGGGGAFDTWFIPALAALAFARRRFRKK
ncbi:MAG TPA: chitobiase/beta-hexosaminidase C-terminal domain-containing protein [Opitutaceae bacterium]|nr:chitobiase/beta-hexosaminidase C-terminal domain-containing protein [Opitutaceae bacterium]